MAITIATISDALTKVMGLRGVTMTDGSTTTVGMVPSEVAAALPAATKTVSAGASTSSTSEPTTTVIDLNVVVANLVEAVKSLTAATYLVCLVSQLPAAATSKGRRAVVTDANLGLLNLGALFGVVVSGGGTTTASVWCDGTYWRIG